MRRELPRGTRVPLVVAVPVVSILWLAPLVWTIAAGLRPGADVFRSFRSLNWRTFIPESVTLDNLTSIASSSLGRAIGNSLIVAGATVVVGLVISAMAAYALTAFRFRGRGLVFALFVLAFVVPFEALAIPLADTARTVGLDNSYIGLILPGVGNGLAIFLLRQFYLDIPAELAEAASIDGAGAWRVFWHVYLPLTRPAMVGAGIIIFVFQWQAYLLPLLLTTDPSMDVGSVALARLFGQYGVDWGMLFAGAAVLCLVPAIILLVFQRTFTESVVGSAVKG